MTAKSNRWWFVYEAEYPEGSDLFAAETEGEAGEMLRASWGPGDHSETEINAAPATDLSIIEANLRSDDPKDVIAAMAHVERLQVLLEETREKLDAARGALQAEKLDHLKTMKTWSGISDRNSKAIAKARRLLRTFSANAPVAAAKAYAALDWRNR